MAKRKDVFPSKYLSAEDLNGEPLTVTILDAPLETLRNDRGEETKTVLYFKETKKRFPLNKTNWDAVAVLCGGDTDDWPGHKIELYPTTTPMAGEVVDCVRVRAPAQRELKPTKPGASGIPF